MKTKLHKSHGCNVRPSQEDEEILRIAAEIERISKARATFMFHEAVERIAAERRQRDFAGFIPIPITPKA
jgi:uncharacterized protein (DUF1778 family)